MSFLEAQLQSRKKIKKDGKDMVETHKRPQKVFFRSTAAKQKKYKKMGKTVETHEGHKKSVLCQLSYLKEILKYCHALSAFGFIASART